MNQDNSRRVSSRRERHSTEKHCEHGDSAAMTLRRHTLTGRSWLPSYCPDAWSQKKLSPSNHQDSYPIL